MEQYRYAIEELVADETAIENKRITQEERDKLFSRQKVGCPFIYDSKNFPSPLIMTCKLLFFLSSQNEQEVQEFVV